VYLLSALNFGFSFMSHIASYLVNIFELQSVAECCSVLQRVAECCRVLQCVAECGRVLQRIAVCRSVLQCVAVCCSANLCSRTCPTSSASYFNLLYTTICTQLCANTLQHNATHCNTLRHRILLNLLYIHNYAVATISRLLKIIGLFCRIESLL